MIKLYVQKKISGTNDHKQLRDGCVNSFAEKLGLKSGERRLKPATMFHKTHTQFDAGDIPTDQNVLHEKPARQVELETMESRWRKDGKVMKKELQKLMAATGFDAYRQGLVSNTDKWEARFQQADKHG